MEQIDKLLDQEIHPQRPRRRRVTQEHLLVFAVHVLCEPQARQELQVSKRRRVAPPEPEPSTPTWSSTMDRIGERRFLMTDTRNAAAPRAASKQGPPAGLATAWRRPHGRHARIIVDMLLDVVQRRLDYSICRASYSSYRSRMYTPVSNRIHRVTNP